MNEEGTLYRINLAENLGISDCELIDLYNLNGVPVIVYVEAYGYVDKSVIQVASFNPDTSKVLNHNSFEFASYLPSSSLVTPDGLLRLYDCGTGTYTYLDNHLLPVKTLSIGTFPDDYATYLTNDSGELFWCYSDDDMAPHLFGKNLMTGETTDYSGLLTDSAYPSILTTLYDDTILVLCISDPNTYQNKEYFINVRDVSIQDTVCIPSLEMIDYGGKYSSLYYNIFPELLLWETRLRTDVICYQYEDQNECYNYLYIPRLSQDYLFTLWSKDAPGNDDSPTSVITTLSCLGVEGNRKLYETTYHNPETIEYLSKPSVYLEQQAYLMGLCDSYAGKYIYLWDLSSAEPCPDQDKDWFLPFIDPADPDPGQLDALQARAQEIGERFGVKINTGFHCETDFGSYLATPAFNLRLITLSLNVLEQTLENYPDDFFHQLSRDGNNILTFELVGSLTGQGEDSLAIAGAVYCYDPVEQCIAIDCTGYSQLEQNIYHELSHATDWFIDEVYAGYYDGEWETYNPEDFTYDYSYVDTDTGYAYCVGDDDSFENDYFIDYYAKTYPTEDRARLAEYSYFSGVELYQESPHIIDKLRFMYEVICDCFDTTAWGGDFFSFDEYFGFPE